MGIRFLCPNGHKLNVKADLAGKRASCPECGAKLLVPAASAEPVVAPAAIVVNPSPPPGGVWYLRTTGGQQLGPATELEVGNWVAGGKLTADAHIWRDGWPDWRLARDAADALPVPLAAIPVTAPPLAPSPIVVDEPLLRSIVALGPEPEVAAAEPIVSDTIVNEAAVPVAAYAMRKRRSKRTQLTLAIVMFLAVIVLAGVLVWVIRKNSAMTPPISRTNSTGNFGAST